MKIHVLNNAYSYRSRCALSVLYCDVFVLNCIYFSGDATF